MLKKSFPIARGAFWSVVGSLALGAGACSLVLNSSETQCETDDDCSIFSNATCDTTTKLCVQKGTGGGGTGGTITTTSTTMAMGGSGGGGAGGGGTGGMPTTTSTTSTTTPKCADPDSEPVTINGDITSDFTMNCQQVYLLEGIVRVVGATLTIEKGTTIKGKYVAPISVDPTNFDKVAALLIEPDAKIIAVGTEDEPIVFTSSQPVGSKKPGDWGGLIILGQAPTNHKDMGGQPTQGKIEGVAGTPGLYGGVNPSHSSGTLKYMRFEYGGYAIAANNEINGITFGGVGRGTVVDHIQVRETADDCFEWFGGTVDAKYLACQHPGDEGFDWDNGFVGRLQFLVLQQDPDIADDTNGFEGDNDATGSLNLPLSDPTIYNATLIGQNVDTAKTQIAILNRRATKASMFNILATGFESGWDVRNPPTSVVFKSSILSGNLVNLITESEVVGMASDDDGGFDEIAYFNDPMNMNSTEDPKLVAPFDSVAPVFGPMVSLTAKAATPPSDGFFEVNATYVGAFKDETDTWATTGAWASWAND